MDEGESTNVNSMVSVPFLRLMRRLMRSANVLMLTAVQSWAWSSLVVPVALTIIAGLAYLVYRRGGHARLGVALDSVLVTAAKVLDSDNVGVPAPYSPLRRAQGAIIRRLTRGAVARRSAPTPEN